MDEDVVWLLSAVIMFSVSMALLFGQAAFGRLLNLLFEICVFHVPTVMLVTNAFRILITRKLMVSTH